MRIFVFEFISGGGWLAERSEPPAGSLLREGLAMRQTLVEDLAAAGYDVVTAHDARLGPVDGSHCELATITEADQVTRHLARLSRAAEWTIVVAPEIAGWLAQYLHVVLDAGARVLSSPLATVRLASDKHATAEHLKSAGVPVPAGAAIEIGQGIPRDFALPGVLKPCDGAGSEGVRWINDRDFVATRRSRIEEFVPGLPASVGFLCGPHGQHALAPCVQVLGDPHSDDRFAYLGGECPLPSPLAERAVRLAACAIRTLDKPLGYLGVDLVLGADEAGREDRVIEINPRLTTSYVGLRALCRDNLADAMIRIADGESRWIEFERGPIQFFADGRLLPAPKILNQTTGV